MKVSLLTTTNSHLAGGLYNSVRSLGLAMLHNGTDVNLISYNDEFSLEDIVAYENLPIEIYNRSELPLLSKLGYSSDLHNLIENLKPDVIHSQGIWMYNSKVALDYKQKYPQTVSIVSPRGMLDPWAIKQSKTLKKIVGEWFEYRHLKSCGCIHALCMSEYESIRKFGLKNPIAVIPNGIILPESFGRYEKEKKVLLFISRIHPKKGLDLLIDAVKMLDSQYPDCLSDWSIRVAGWNQVGHEEYLRKKVEELHLAHSITFIGPVLGNSKRDELIKADAFILPSYSEGLPMSILEAWSYKLPVVMTKFCNLPEGFESNAALKIDLNPEDIARNLKKLFEMNETERIAMGENGYRLVKSQFTWHTIAEKTENMYRWLLGKDSKPEFVYE